MRKALLVLTASVALMVSGCLTLSINPLYTTDDIVSVPEAAGTWSKSDDSSEWTFTPQEEYSYTITNTDDHGAVGEFVGWFVRVNHDLYLDLYPNGLEGANVHEAVHYVPAHSFWRVQLADDQLTLEYIDLDKFGEGINNGWINIPYVVADDMLVLTAETPDLQAFLNQNMDRLVTEDPFVLKRSE